MAIADKDLLTLIATKNEPNPQTQEVESNVGEPPEVPPSWKTYAKKILTQPIDTGVNYRIRPNFGVHEMLCEIIMNARDAEIKHSAPFIWSYKDGLASFKTNGAVLLASDFQTISHPQPYLRYSGTYGRFRNGLATLAAISSRQRHKVNLNIYSNGLSYTPILLNNGNVGWLTSEKDDSAKSSVIVRVWNVSKADVEFALGRFRWAGSFSKLIETESEASTVLPKSSFNTQYGKINVDESCVVWVNGFRLSRMYRLLYSYDIDADLSFNRDLSRDVDLSQICALMWHEAYLKEKDKVIPYLNQLAKASTIDALCLKDIFSKDEINLETTEPLPAAFYDSISNPSNDKYLDPKPTDEIKYDDLYPEELSMLKFAATAAVGEYGDEIFTSQNLSKYLKIAKLSVSGVYKIDKHGTIWLDRTCLESRRKALSALLAAGAERIYIDKGKLLSTWVLTLSVEAIIKLHDKIKELDNLTTTK